MISSPRQPGTYTLRAHDCEEALQHPVAVMLRGCHAPFLDFMTLLHAILPAATEAGWQEPEVRSALREVTSAYRLSARS